MTIYLLKIHIIIFELFMEPNNMEFLQNFLLFTMLYLIFLQFQNLLIL